SNTLSFRQVSLPNLAHFSRKPSLKTPTLAPRRFQTHRKATIAKIRRRAKLRYELKTSFHQQVLSESCFRLRYLYHWHADAGAREPYRCSTDRAKSAKLRN